MFYIFCYYYTNYIKLFINKVFSYSSKTFYLNKLHVINNNITSL